MKYLHKFKKYFFIFLLSFFIFMLLCSQNLINADIHSNSLHYYKEYTLTYGEYYANRRLGNITFEQFSTGSIPNTVNQLNAFSPNCFYQVYRIEDNYTNVYEKGEHLLVTYDLDATTNVNYEIPLIINYNQSEGIIEFLMVRGAGNCCFWIEINATFGSSNFAIINLFYNNSEITSWKYDRSSIIAYLGIFNSSVYGNYFQIKYYPNSKFDLLIADMQDFNNNLTSINNILTGAISTPYLNMSLGIKTDVLNSQTIFFISVIDFSHCKNFQEFRALNYEIVIVYRYIAIETFNVNIPLLNAYNISDCEIINISILSNYSEMYIYSFKCVLGNETYKQVFYSLLTNQTIDSSFYSNNKTFEFTLEISSLNPIVFEIDIYLYFYYNISYSSNIEPLHTINLFFQSLPIIFILFVPSFVVYPIFKKEGFFIMFIILTIVCISIDMIPIGLGVLMLVIEMLIFILIMKYTKKGSET